MKKKIKELTQKEISKLNKMLGECEIISFDPKKIQKKVELAYELRTDAHVLMLESDVLLDEVLKEIYGDYKTTKVRKTR